MTADSMLYFHRKGIGLAVFFFGGKIKIKEDIYPIFLREMSSFLGLIHVEVTLKFQSVRIPVER